MLAKMLRSLFENPINDIFQIDRIGDFQWIINQNVSDVLRSGQKLTSPIDLDFQDPWESKTSYCRSRKKIRGYTSQIEEQKCTILVFLLQPIIWQEQNMPQYFGSVFENFPKFLWIAKRASDVMTQTRLRQTNWNVGWFWRFL